NQGNTNNQNTNNTGNQGNTNNQNTNNTGNQGNVGGLDGLFTGQDDRNKNQTIPPLSNNPVPPVSTDDPGYKIAETLAFDGNSYVLIIQKVDGSGDRPKICTDPG
ncbi:MAG: hypothetical protein QM532_03880, partial [Cyanobium sp. MAG06]|nr:hypothetical protein [Cyanobium sp. MAG06]